MDNPEISYNDNIYIYGDYLKLIPKLIGKSIFLLDGKNCVEEISSLSFLLPLSGNINFHVIIFMEFNQSLPPWWKNETWYSLCYAHGNGEISVTMAEVAFELNISYLSIFVISNLPFIFELAVLYNIVAEKDIIPIDINNINIIFLCLIEPSFVVQNYKSSQLQEILKSRYISCKIVNNDEFINKIYSIYKIPSDLIRKYINYLDKLIINRIPLKFDRFTYNYPKIK